MSIDAADVHPAAAFVAVVQNKKDAHETDWHTCDQRAKADQQPKTMGHADRSVFGLPGRAALPLTRVSGEGVASGALRAPQTDAVSLGDSSSGSGWSFDLSSLTRRRGVTTDG